VCVCVCHRVLELERGGGESKSRRNASVKQENCKEQRTNGGELRTSDADAAAYGRRRALSTGGHSAS